MPLPILAEVLWKGLSSIPYAYVGLKIALLGAVVGLVKYYFEGARNPSERPMHGKVVIVTVRSLNLPDPRKMCATTGLIQESDVRAAHPAWVQR